MDFCNVRSGNEKGLVENLVGLARRNVLVPVPHADSIAELNGNLEQYCTRYIEKHTVTGRPGAVSKLLRQDREKLLPLPGRPYDVRATDVGRISPYATLRFQTNAYSVPVKYVGQEATLKASAEDVAIYVDGKIVATHSRCYQKHKQVLALSHYLPLLERKPRSIAQALPVRQNLSPAMLTLLNTTNFSAKDLVDILRLCAEQGEDAFWKNEIEFLERPARPVCINDTVSVDEVDLSRYDHFLEGGNALCRMQA